MVKKNSFDAILCFDNIPTVINIQKNKILPIGIKAHNCSKPVMIFNITNITILVVDKNNIIFFNKLLTGLKFPS